MMKKNNNNRAAVFMASIALSLLLVAVATGPFFLMQDAEAKFTSREQTDKLFCEYVKDECLKNKDANACYLYTKYC